MNKYNKYHRPKIINDVTTLDIRRQLFNKKRDVYYNSFKNGSYKIIKETKNGFLIEFIITKFRSEVTIDQIRHGDIIDYKRKTLNNKSYKDIWYEEIKESDPRLCKEMYRIYSRMIQNKENIEVDEKWNSFCNFYLDAINLNGYNREDLVCKRLVLEYDKLYSFNTCYWRNKKLK